MVLEQWGILHLLWQGALVLSVSFWRTALFYHLKDRPICHLKDRPILSVSFEGQSYFVI